MTASTRTAAPAPAGAEAPPPTALRELAALFLRLGATAFGGPAAHLAMFEDEVVRRRRRWLSEERFLDLLAAVNLIPGPNSTEMALHIGWERRRLPGLLVAGVSFILPAALITAACAAAYLAYGALPAAAGLLYGVKPAILAVVVQAIVRLTPRAARTASLRLLGALALLLALLGVDELILLGGAAALGLAARLAHRRAPPPPALLLPVALLPGVAAAAPAAAAAAAPASLLALFALFLKVGAVLFGSGYVLLAFLRADLVVRLGWLSEAQLLDAIAVGQFTPGPVFTTATFVGYLLGGPAGAAVATVGIFLPAFVLVALSGPLIPRLRAAPAAAAALDAVAVASLALMVGVTLHLARAAIVDAPTLAIAASAALLLLRARINATWLVLGGAAAGLLVHALRAA